MSRNQRRHPRVKPKLLSARVRVAGQLHIGLAVENLSLGGAFVRCATAPPLRTHATLEVAVQGVTTPLMLPGKVAFVVAPADAVAKKLVAGFAIEFNQPIPGHLQAGLERLLRTIDPKALIPLETEDTERTQAHHAFVPGGHPTDPEVPTPATGELGALRKLVESHEREIRRLRTENAQLREALRVAKSR